MDINNMLDRSSPCKNPRRPFACTWPDCAKCFSRNSDLQRHFKIHTQERPFACQYVNCNKSFIQRSALTVHFRTHTGEKPYLCMYIGCEKRFSDSSSLARHMRTHCAKPGNRCPQPGCGKLFPRRIALYRHLQIVHNIDSNPEQYARSQRLMIEHAAVVRDAAAANASRSRSAQVSANGRVDALLPIRHIYGSSLQGAESAYTPATYAEYYYSLQQQQQQQQTEYSDKSPHGGPISPGTMSPTSSAWTSSSVSSVEYGDRPPSPSCSNNQPSSAYSYPPSTAYSYPAYQYHSAVASQQHVPRDYACFDRS